MLVLTKARRRKLQSVSDEWERQEDGWRAGGIFLDLLDADLVEWREVRINHGDVIVGPGAHPVWRWEIRRTAAGRDALQHKEPGR